MTQNTITVNVWDSEKIFLRAIEGEASSRKIIIKLIDEQGPINLTDKIVNFLARKPDGNIIYNTVEILSAQEGLISLELTEQVCAVNGILENCEINVLDLHGEKLVAKKADLIIEPSICSDIEESLSEITAVKDLIIKVNNLENHSLDLNNPHQVNCGQIGAVPSTRKINNKELTQDISLTSTDVNAASVNHSHSLSDINFSNGLPINLGGTGATTLSSAKENLEIYPVYTTNAGIINYPCTTAELLAALPNKSTIILSISSNTSSITDLPKSSGILNIIKENENSAKITFNHTDYTNLNNSCSYTGFFSSNGISTNIIWEKTITSTGSVVSINKGGTGANNLQGAITNFKEGIVDLIYPVGSIYFSSNNISPSTLFGGTWEQIKDQFILAAGDTYTAGSTGGEEQHVLTTNEMPEHCHKSSFYSGYWAYCDADEGYATNEGPASGTGRRKELYYLDTGFRGKSYAHNNMPPYIVAYCWKRTA